MPEWINTDDPLSEEDPTLPWLRAHHPERLAARQTDHPFVHIETPVPEACPPGGGPECICSTCWERKKRGRHKEATR